MLAYKMGRFEFFKSKINYHGTQKPGQKYNQGTVKGWKIKVIKLVRLSPGISLRFILYFPSGAWWSLDYFSPLKIERVKK